MEHLGGNRQVLEAGTVRRTTSKRAPCPGSVRRARRALCAHVVTANMVSTTPMRSILSLRDVAGAGGRPMVPFSRGPGPSEREGARRSLLVARGDHRNVCRRHRAAVTPPSSAAVRAAGSSSRRRARRRRSRRRQSVASTASASSLIFWTAMSPNTVARAPQRLATDAHITLPRHVLLAEPPRTRCRGRWPPNDPPRDEEEAATEDIQPERGRRAMPDSVVGRLPTWRTATSTRRGRRYHQRGGDGRPRVE